jgi:hypothetical protein
MEWIHPADGGLRCEYNRKEATKYNSSASDYNRSGQAIQRKEAPLNVDRTGCPGVERDEARGGCRLQLRRHHPKAVTQRPRTVKSGNDRFVIK